MTLENWIKTSTLTAWTPIYEPSLELEGLYIGDLLSWVMGHGQPGQIWATVQAHENVIAIAKLKEFGAVVLVEGVIPSKELIAYAREEQCTLLGTSLDAAQFSKAFYEHNPTV
ncbi:MAG: hypothetical protein ACRDBX_08410 [Erysipelotrichaceae bacterium]